MMDCFKLSLYIYMMDRLESCHVRTYTPAFGKKLAQLAVALRKDSFGLQEPITPMRFYGAFSHQKPDRFNK